MNNNFSKSEDIEYIFSFLWNTKEEFINATEMARHFGKKISHYLDHSHRAEIVLLLCERQSKNNVKVKRPVSLTVGLLAELFPESVKIEKGENNQLIIWFCNKIALEFAKWLSPEFMIWNLDRIMELATNGIAISPLTMERLIDNPDLAIELLTNLKREREQKSEILNWKEAENQLKQFVEIYDQLKDSRSLDDFPF